jgi:hypothetical protein
MISRELNMPIKESRHLLAEAVEALGVEHYRLTYITQHQDAQGNFNLVHYKAKPPLPAFLHSVQRKTDFSASVFSTEQKFKRLRIEDSINALYHDMSANIAPVQQSIRSVLLSQRPGSAPQSKPPATLKKEETTKTPVKASSSSPFSHPNSKGHTVRFECIEKVSDIKRNPPPMKLAVTSLDHIMMTEVFEIEDDPTDLPVKRKHSPDNTSAKRSKTDVSEVPSDQPRVYVDDSGSLGTC